MASPVTSAHGIKPTDTGRHTRKPSRPGLETGTCALLQKPERNLARPAARRHVAGAAARRACSWPWTRPDAGKPSRHKILPVRAARARRSTIMHGSMLDMQF